MPNTKTKKIKPKERETITKKTRNKKEAAQTRNKKRAKGINKASRRAAQTNIFSEYFRRAVKYTIKADKSEQSAQKAAKNAAATYPRVL